MSELSDFRAHGLARTLSISFFVAALLVGCESNNVFVAADSTIGVSGSINSAKTSGKLLVGYDRAFIAYVPRKTDTGDALSTYNCTHFEVTGIQITRFSESLATGDAAIEHAAKTPGTGVETLCDTATDKRISQ